MEALTDACVLCGNGSLELSAKGTSGKLRRPQIQWKPQKISGEPCSVN